MVNINRTRSFLVIAVASAVALSSAKAAEPKDADQPSLSATGRKLQAGFDEQLSHLRSELKQQIPAESNASGKALKSFLNSDALDAKFAEFVVLLEATPRGLAGFAQQNKDQQILVDSLLKDSTLMKRMLVADGASAPKQGRNGYGPAQWGPAMQILGDIRTASDKATNGVLERLALAIALEHAVPIAQTNPAAQQSAAATIDPVNRYLHFEQAYVDT